MIVVRTLIVAAAIAAAYGCAVVQQEDKQESVASVRQERESAARARQEQESAAGVGKKGEQKLNASIRHYENGKYDEAVKDLRASLELGLGESNLVKAYKYLAFIYCVTEQEARCKAHFRMALTIDPSFELEPAEAGHPIWGPAFRSVKSNP